MSRTRNVALALFTTIVLLAATAYGLLQVSKSRSFQLFGDLVDRVDTDQRVVALTFDDAPLTQTSAVLDILREKDVTGTFYMIGESIEQQPAAAAEIAEAGHELGNHSYSHRRMVATNETPGFVRDELDRTDDLIRSAGYRGEITFRPPYGKKFLVLPWQLSQRGTTAVTWDVEPDTYHAGDAQALADYTVNNTRPGSIILMHPFCDVACEADREALPQVIDRLRADGYRFVTVRELLAMRR